MTILVTYISGKQETVAYLLTTHANKETQREKAALSLRRKPRNSEL